MKFQITPKILILSILQVADRQTIPVKLLVAVGKIFGFTGNTIRVTITRLIREGRIENDERGLYRLSDGVSPFSRYLESWRLGEQRVKPWDGRWIVYYGQGNTRKNQKKKNEKLKIAGFKTGWGDLYVRPNNLNIEIHRLKELVSHLTENTDPFLFVGSEFETGVTREWQKNFWPVDELIRAQTACLEKLEKSSARLEGLSSEAALMESYLLGSEAVHLLVNDPLLPEEMMPSCHRIALTRMMLAYDTLGKAVWKKQFMDLDIRKTPSHVLV